METESEAVRPNVPALVIESLSFWRWPTEIEPGGVAVSAMATESSALADAPERAATESLVATASVTVRVKEPEPARRVRWL